MPQPTNLEQALRAAVRGEVAFDRLTRGVYATDASLYQIEPLGVVTPRDGADVVAATRVAAEHGVPILPRAGGTSLGGSAVGAALVLDVSRHMNQLRELNVAERWARVQPGLVRDNLNALLKPTGLMYAPDPATGNRACVGGMIGNNSSGMRSILYGKTVDQLIAVKVVLPDGRVTWLGEPQQDDEVAAELRARVMAVVDANRDEIAARYPKIMRRVQGYNLDELCGDTPNLAKLICGSEGTLATIIEAKVNLVPQPKAVALLVAHFDDLLVSLRATQQVLGLGPSAVEIIDDTVLGLARGSATTAKLCDWIQGDPRAILAIEFFGETPAEAVSKARSCGDGLLEAGTAYAVTQMPTAAEQAKLWAVRKAGLGVMMRIRGDRKPIPGIEDGAVPIEVLPEYIDGVLAICRRHETQVTLYAHCSVGLIHLRPILSMKDADDIARFKAICDDTFALIKQYGGSISGEHGDGIARSCYLEWFFGPTLYQAFREVKAVFDPRGLMNPGKIIHGPPIDQNLRLGADYHATTPTGYFDYSVTDGLDRAIETCNGVGACRQLLAGTMCPTYRATRDEMLTPRARANVLRLAASGHYDGIGDPALAPVLDTCLACKACKTECPSNVDIARLRAEALAERHAQHGTPPREHLVVASPTLARLLSGPLAPIANAVAGSRPVRWLNEKLLGLDARRVPPAYARVPFERWFDSHHAPDGERPEVVLFDDTWLRYHDTAVGIGAVELLESCGYRVTLARAGCCQRPAISHGNLALARREGERTLRNLDRWLSAGVPIVCCEPSCASALTDDLPSLIADKALGERAVAGIQMIDVFLARELAAGRLQATFRSTARRVLLHGHCHQKSLFGTKAMTDILALVPGLRVDEADCGCCGMAGSFGYEQEHYDLSMQVAEDRLLPAVRAAGPDATVVACGFSCRHQIVDGTGVKAKHWVEVVRADGRE